jgi:hypothetical protein
MIHRQTSHRRGKEVLWRAHFGLVCPEPAKIRFLNDVFRVRRTAEHPVRDGKQERAMLAKHFETRIGSEIHRRTSWR